MATLPDRRKRKVTAKQGAAIINKSERTVRRRRAQAREEWIQEQRARRRLILETYEGDEALTWEDVAREFGIKPDTARQLARRARKERQAERDAVTHPPLPLDEFVA